MGNNRVVDHVIALYKSLCYFNSKVSITLIPYSNDYDRILEGCNIKLFPNLMFLAELEAILREMLSLSGAPPQANKYPRLKNLASWFGEYDTFVSFDADIIAFTDIEKFALEILGNYDFACYDRLYKHGIKWVFTEKIREKFSNEKLKKVFNGGFWVSRKGLFSKEELFIHLEKCKSLYDFFDFKNGALAQPILNHLILSHVNPEKIHNPLQGNSEYPEPWSGFHYEEILPNILGNNKYKLPFLHWAGKEICPENKYYKIWKYYRDLK